MDKLATFRDMGLSLQTIYVVFKKIASKVRSSKIDQVVEVRIGDLEGTVHISDTAIDAAEAAAAAAKAAAPAAKAAKGQQQPEEQEASTKVAKTKGPYWHAVVLYELHLSLDGKVSLR